MNQAPRHNLSFIDVPFFVFVFLIPMIPRPTVDHPVRYFAPGAIVGLCYLYSLWFMGRRSRLPISNRLGLLLFLSLSTLLIYFVNIAMKSSSNELPYFVSRALFIAILLVMLLWMTVNQISVSRLFKVLFWGYILLACVIIFVGVSGIGILGEVRPARTYGIKLPFFKTTGVPRSYGEFGIIACAAWSYFLVNKRNLGRLCRLATSTAILLSVFISQSRSTYIGMLLVSISYFVLSRKPTRLLIGICLLVSLFIPLILSTSMSVIEESRLGRALMGEGIYEKNVHERFSTFHKAENLLLNEPKRLALGISHAEWVQVAAGVEDVDENSDVGLHNHFLSNVIFLGLFGGSIALLIFFVPLVDFYRYAHFDVVDNQLLFLSFCGMSVCLNFYEGFFSVIVALELSCLWLSYGNQWEVAFPND